MAQLLSMQQGVCEGDVFNLAKVEKDPFRHIDSTKARVKEALKSCSTLANTAKAKADAKLEALYPW